MSEESGTGGGRPDLGRRDFLGRSSKGLTALGGLLALGPAHGWATALHPHPRDRAAPGAGGVLPIQPIGVQLYTVRSIMADDVAGTLETVAAIGYREVEFAGLHGTPPARMRTLLDRLGLNAVSIHVSVDLVRSDPTAVLDEADALGSSFITCPSLGRADRGSLDGFRRVADDFNAFGEAARGRGFQFAYHNHDFEFEPIDGIVPYDLLLERCDAELVKMQMDVFWTVNGGRDPLEYFREHPGRFPMIHAKDRSASGEMVDVGAGVIDFAAILAAAETAGLRHWLVEHDRPEDPLASIRSSYDTLAALGG